MFNAPPAPPTPPSTAPLLLRHHQYNHFLPFQPIKKIIAHPRFISAPDDRRRLKSTYLRFSVCVSFSLLFLSVDASAPVATAMATAHHKWSRLFGSVLSPLSLSLSLPPLSSVCMFSSSVGIDVWSVVVGAPGGVHVESPLRSDGSTATRADAGVAPTNNGRRQQHRPSLTDRSRRSVAGAGAKASSAPAATETQLLESPLMKMASNAGADVRSVSHYKQTSFLSTGTGSTTFGERHGPPAPPPPPALPPHLPHPLKSHHNPPEPTSVMRSVFFSFLCLFVYPSHFHFSHGTFSHFHFHFLRRYTFFYRYWYRFMHKIAQQITYNDAKILRSSPLSFTLSFLISIHNSYRWYLQFTSNIKVNVILSQNHSLA